MHYEVEDENYVNREHACLDALSAIATKHTIWRVFNDQLAT